MANEVETKVLDIDVDDVMRKLAELGAAKTAENKLTVDWFRLKGVEEGKDPWFLRIRSYSDGRHEATWKAKSKITKGVRRHKEINLLLQEPDKLADLFCEIGLERYAHQEKFRASFKHKGWSFDIDRYPGMPAFMEIEGNDEGHVSEALELLGLGSNRTWADGERTLIEKVYGLVWSDMRF
ncbi:MAG: hypothetical protein KGI69_02195 [Patescibacteria group bacterium]|nr:hypothetical protein [Patescibacteria group bacterium]